MREMRGWVLYYSMLLYYPNATSFLTFWKERLFVFDT